MIARGLCPPSELMTWQEFQNEFGGIPLEQMDIQRLRMLCDFSPSSLANAEDIGKFDEAKGLMRREMARRVAGSERLDEAGFRRQERQRADRQHDQYAEQSSNMHVSQMERAHASFLLHRRSIWIAAIITVASALLAWASLWQQRNETQRALDGVIKRLEVLEAGGKSTGAGAGPASGR